MIINTKTRLCASLAYPNRKTTAPIMYNAGFDAVGVNLRYVALEPKDIGEAVQAIRVLDFVGVSIARPYKEKAIQYLDELDQTAEKIGAVNVVHNVDGRLKGYNSDWIGAINALKEHADLAGKTVAVLGAGGASRAIAYGLKLQRSNVHVFNRSEERGRALAQDFDLIWGGGMNMVAAIKPDIIINATPVGRGNNDVSLIDRDALCHAEIVMDINVQKGYSDLLKTAQEQEVTVINGVRMLVLQGAFTFELFSGKEAPVGIMQSAVERALK